MIDGKPTEYKFQSIYKFLSIVYMNVEAVVDFWNFNEEAFVQSALKFNRKSLLHIYVASTLYCYYWDEFSDMTDDYEVEWWINTICCWAWTDSPSDNFTGGSWPGAACELLGTAPNGNTVWKWTWDGKKQKGSSARQPAKIIFNNNDKPQTDDLNFTQAGYYNENGLQGVVTATAIAAPKDVRRSMSNAQWHDLHGRRLNGHPSKIGVYIHNGKKTVIK